MTLDGTPHIAIDRRDASDDVLRKPISIDTATKNAKSTEVIG